VNSIKNSGAAPYFGFCLFNWDINWYHPRGG